jgi:hypothetical protein
LLDRYVALVRQVEITVEVSQEMTDTRIGDSRELAAYCEDCAPGATTSALQQIGVVAHLGEVDPVGVLCCRCHGRIVRWDVEHVTYVVELCLIEDDFARLQPVEMLSFAPVCTDCEDPYPEASTAMGSAQ